MKKVPRLGPKAFELAAGFLRVDNAENPLAGFALAPLPAAAAGLAGGMLSVLASAASFVSAPYAWVDPAVFVDIGRAHLVASNVHDAFLNPATYIVLAGWTLSAVVMSWLSGRATRLAAMVGALLGMSVLGGAYALADQASVALGNGSVWVSTQLAISLCWSQDLVRLSDRKWTMGSNSAEHGGQEGHA